MILKENNSLKSEGEAEARRGRSGARLAGSRAPPAASEPRGRAGTERLLRPARAAPSPPCLVPHRPQGFLLPPPGRVLSPSEMDKLCQGQRLSGSCLEIRLSLSANELWIYKVNITHLSLPQFTTVDSKDPSSNLSIFILNMVSFLSLIRLLSPLVVYAVGALFLFYS